MNREEFDQLFKTLYVVQNPDDFFWLIGYVQSINPQIILELGVEKGGSLKFWEQLLPVGGLLIGVDSVDNMSWRESDRNVNLVVGFTTDQSTVDSVRKILNGRKADFIFMDASSGHNPDVCEQEFNLYKEFLKDGGLMGFDDAGDVSRFLAKLAGIIFCGDMALYTYR